MSNINDRSGVFIHKIEVINGTQAVGEIMFNHITDACIIENASMDGVLLIANIVDPNLEYRDKLKIGLNTILQVTYGDSNINNGELYIDRFVVMQHESMGGILNIQGFQETIHKLKRPANGPTFFTCRTPHEILARLMPNVTLNVDNFPVGTYHITPGLKPSRLIRSMCRDYGAVAFYCRGTFFFKRLADLYSHESKFSFGYNDNTADIVINKYCISNQKFMYERILDRRYVQWDTVLGLITSGKDRSFGTVSITAGNDSSVYNQHQAIVPTLVADHAGIFSVKPGLCIDISILNPELTDRPIDESIISKQFINSVTHYQKGTSYVCRTELGIPHGK